MTAATTTTRTISYNTTTRVDSSPVTTAANTTTTKRPDRDAGIQWVLVLSYQRSGSSFIGRIFNDPGRVFYVYEPLDPVYSAMYGVEDTRTVPSDIFSTRDGQIRTIPKDELQAVGWAMERIYSCQLSSLPIAALAHSFWFRFQREMPSKNYVDCLQRNRVGRNTSLRCLKHIEERCAGRFLERPEDLEQCKSFLWGNESGDGIVPNGNKYRHSVTNSSLPSDIRAYFDCFVKVEPIVTHCAEEFLDKPCRDSNIRAIKTVRANMDTANYLLETHHNTRLIHLYRDPRGAVSSRMKSGFSQGFYSNGNAAKEAQLYCSQVLADVRKRLYLETHGHSAKIKELVYDAYVQNPLKNLLDVYNFTGTEPSTELKTSVLSETNNSESISKKWQKRLRSEKEQTIVDNCKKFYEETTFQWSGL